MNFITALFALLCLSRLSYAQRQDADTLVCTFPEARAKYDVARYIKQNLRYPDSATKYGIEGRVLVQFTINKNGTVSRAKVLRGIGYGCDEEALRLIKNMPRWQPARTPGAPAKEVFTQPVLFRQE